MIAHDCADGGDARKAAAAEPPRTAIRATARVNVPYSMGRWPAVDGETVPPCIEISPATVEQAQFFR